MLHSEIRKRRKPASFRPTLENLEDRATPAVVAFHIGNTLAVFGDNADNNIEISRDSAGKILVNGGAISVKGAVPTTANTSSISVFGLGGNDTITLNESGGALPRALLYGGAGNDTMTGGSGNDLMFGQTGNDTLLGRGGNDSMFGGAGNDTLTGGVGSDQAFGEAGNDRMIWNPGDGTDLNEGGAGTDIVEINGGNGDEEFTVTANGNRVRFDRVNPAPFSVDIGTSENLVVNMNGGNDRFSASGNLSGLIQLTVDGGAGNDTILGGNGNDLLLGGDGDDFIDGNQGSDIALMGAGNDVFQWDPGDGSDVVEGQAGTDKMIFNGANVAENIDISANGERVRFFRNVANITMDLNDVEAIDFRALGGADTVVINDLSGTDVTSIDIDLSSAITGGDGAADTIIVNGTNLDDVILTVGDASGVSVFGLTAQVNIKGHEAGLDQLVINGLGGDDVIEASDLAAVMIFTGNGGDGDDVLIGGDGNDTLTGGDGDDVLVGGLGTDILDGGLGDNVLIQ